jgi:hypothetical protein
MSRRLRQLDRLTAIFAALAGLMLLFAAVTDRPMTRIALASYGAMALTLAARIALGCGYDHREGS